MATRLNTFLIKATSGREGIMRLPIDRYGGMTTKAHKMIEQRFYDGATSTPGSMKYALNLEAFTSADSLMQALEHYKNDTI